MFYEERIIDGVLCHRGTPDGEWIKFSAEDLTGMLNNWRNLKYALKDLLFEIPDDSPLKSTARNLFVIIHTLP